MGKEDIDMCAMGREIRGWLRRREGKGAEVVRTSEELVQLDE